MIDPQLATGLGLWVVLSGIGLLVLHRSRLSEANATEDDEWTYAADSFDD